MRTESVTKLFSLAVPAAAAVGLVLSMTLWAATWFAVRRTSSNTSRDFTYVTQNSKCYALVSLRLGGGDNLLFYLTDVWPGKPGFQIHSCDINLMRGREIWFPLREVAPSPKDTIIVTSVLFIAKQKVSILTDGTGAPVWRSGATASVTMVNGPPTTSILIILRGGARERCWRVFASYALFHWRSVA